jgi:hypothetical protein
MQRIRAMRGGAHRRLAAWIGWNEGWVTLRAIAAPYDSEAKGTFRI